jgi:hypothetical protein
MSWSFQAVGRPDAVLRALDTQNAGLTDQSKVEWDEAKPALKALVGANAGNVMVEVNASGHAQVEVRPVAHDTEGSPTKTERVRVAGQCNVTIRSLYGFVE